MVWVEGFEPSVSGFQGRRFTKLSYTQNMMIDLNWSFAIVSVISFPFQV